MEKYKKKNDCDVPLGNRFGGSRIKKKMNVLFKTAQYGKFFIEPKCISDPKTPFRCYNRKALDIAIFDRERNVQTFDDPDSLKMMEFPISLSS
ncbi:MAG: hypothetical protein JXA22_09005 [Candidatus Thermoplasmatota archaeon]|nr:hypothetical protein [Candidatus Thermoplasmatota archaeon]